MKRPENQVGSGKARPNTTKITPHPVGACFARPQNDRSSPLQSSELDRTL